MAIKVPFLFSVLVLAALLDNHIDAAKPTPLVPFNRSNFPAGFIFGAGSAAYQAIYAYNALNFFSVATSKKVFCVYANNIVHSIIFQSEGAAYLDGKGPSIWDIFAKEHPGL